MIYLTAQAFPPRSGGIENLMSAFAHYASLSGCEVQVLADGRSEERDFDASNSVPYSVERFGGLKPLRRRKKAYQLGKRLRKRPAPIYADSWKSIEHLPKDTSVPVVVFGHGNEFPRILEDGTFPKRTRIQKALAKASRLIVVSEETRQRALPFLPDGLEVEIIHPPVEPAALMSESDKAYAEALWPHADKLKCLVLCRLIEWKGVDMAIRAVAETDNTQLVIAGTGDDKARLDALVSELGVADRVAFVGRIEGGRKSALFEQSDIFLQAGRRVGDQCEGFGITYTEAGLHGLAAISGDQGGAVEAVLDGKTGLVIDATVSKNVTLALENLIKNADMRADLSHKAKEHAKTLLWPRQIDRILAVSGT